MAASVRAGIPLFFGLFAFFTPISIAASHTSLAIATLLLLLDPESRAAAASALRGHPLVPPLIVWILFQVFAVALAEDPARSFEKLKKLALLPLLPLGVPPVVRRALRPMLAGLIVSAAGVAVVGMVRYWLEGGGLAARIAGIASFYMTIAGILMMVGLLVLGELLSALKDPHSRRIVFVSIGGVAIVAALVLTYTRGSWIGFLAGALWLLRRHRLALLLVIMVCVLVFALGPPELRDRAVSIFDPGHPRNVERVLIWEHGLDIVKEKPLFGVGLVPPPERMNRQRETEHGVVRVHSHMHNAYLQIAVTMGIPALIAFGWLIGTFFRTGIRARRAPLRNLWEEGLVTAYPAILLALLVNGLFEWNFGDSEVLGLFYYLSGCVIGIETESGA